MALLALHPAVIPGRPAQQASSAETVPSVRVASDDARKMTAYIAASSACRVSWEVFLDEPYGGEIRRYSDCNRSWNDEMPLLSDIVAEVFKDPARRRQVRTLTWGRLAPDGAKDTPMAVRLALAAAGTLQWSRTLGRPKTGDINRFIRDLANEARIYPELETVLAEAGMAVTVRTVEKVLVGPAGKTAFFEALSKEGIRSADKIPFDCQVWFLLAPK